MTSSLLNRVAFVAIGIISANCAIANEPRPRLFQKGDEWCFYKSPYGQHVIDCGKSSEFMLKKLQQEVALIDGAARRERELDEEEKILRKEAKKAQALRFKQMDDELMAQNPKVWACVMKRLPRGTSPTEATDRDIEKCTKGYDRK